MQCLNSADDGPTWGRPQTEKDVNVTGDRATARQHSGVMFDNTHYTTGWFMRSVNTRNTSVPTLLHPQSCSFVQRVREWGKPSVREWGKPSVREWEKPSVREWGKTQRT